VRRAGAGDVVAEILQRIPLRSLVGFDGEFLAARTHRYVLRVVRHPARFQRGAPDAYLEVLPPDAPFDPPPPEVRRALRREPMPRTLDAFHRREQATLRSVSEKENPNVRA